MDGRQPPGVVIRIPQDVQLRIPRVHRALRALFGIRNSRHLPRGVVPVVHRQRPGLRLRLLPLLRHTPVLVVRIRRGHALLRLPAAARLLRAHEPPAAVGIRIGDRNLRRRRLSGGKVPLAHDVAHRVIRIPHDAAVLPRDGRHLPVRVVRIRCGHALFRVVRVGHHVAQLAPAPVEHRRGRHAVGARHRAPPGGGRMYLPPGGVDFLVRYAVVKVRRITLRR